MFQPSDKQISAILNMENFLGFNDYREGFDSVEDFQAYWDRLDTDCKKHKSIQGAMQRKASKGPKKVYVYVDVESLTRYARKYVHRYQPSLAKLTAQLLKRTENNTALVDEVMALFAPIIDDFHLALTRAQTMAAAGKNEQQIRTKLFDKRFNRETIGLVIEDLHRHDSAYDTHSGDTMTRWEQSQHSTLLRLVEGFQRQDVPERKIIDRLLRKGFRYDDIRTVLTDSGNP